MHAGNLLQFRFFFIHSFDRRQLTQSKILLKKHTLGTTAHMMMKRKKMIPRNGENINHLTLYGAVYDVVNSNRTSACVCAFDIIKFTENFLSHDIYDDMKWRKVKKRQQSLRVYRFLYFLTPLTRTHPRTLGPIVGSTLTICLAFNSIWHHLMFGIPFASYDLRQ